MGGGDCYEGNYSKQQQSMTLGRAYGAGYGSVVDTVTEGRVETAETIIALSGRARSFQESCRLLCTVVSGGTVCHRRGDEPLSETSLQPKQESLLGLS